MLYQTTQMTIRTLQEYIQKIKDLILYRGRYPHKPFLLLIIVEMMEQGEMWENNIPFREILKKETSFFSDLIEVANEQDVLTTELKLNIHNPFFHLKTSGFWNLYPIELRTLGKIRPEYLLNANAFAKLDDRFFLLLTNPEYREMIRQTLFTILNTHFPNIQPQVERVIAVYRTRSHERIAEDIEGYSEQLIQDTERPFSTHRDVVSIQVETPVRSAGFRQAIMKIYKYKCAVCELNIQAASGESVTDAAHIVPFSVSYNDDVRNGMSLCKSHHWAFDAGLIAVGEEHRIIVSPAMTEQGPTASMLTGLRDREIWRPREPEYCPAPEALTWHREQVMRQ